MTADVQFTIHRDNMIKAFDELLKMLTALDRTDSEAKEKYRENVLKGTSTVVREERSGELLTYSTSKVIRGYSTAGGD